MDPEKDTQTENPITPAAPDNMGPDTQPPVTGTTGPVVVGNGSSNNKWLLWLLMVLVIAIAAFAAWWFFMREDSANNNTDTAVPTENTGEQTGALSCDEGMVVYTNEDLGIEFCYPTAWGAPSVTDAKFAAADTGERWTVSFADKDAVHLGVVSEDWTTAVGRDGVCADPAVVELPAFTPFSTAWVTEGTPTTSASRGVEHVAGQYLVREHVDNVLTNGVCLEGYTVIDDEIWRHTAASYFAEFTVAIPSPAEHMAEPNILIPVADRDDFAAFVASVRAL